MDSKEPFNSDSELYLLANTTGAEAGGIKFDFVVIGLSVGMLQLD